MKRAGAAVRCLPRDQDDVAAVDALKAGPAMELGALVPQLMTWLKNPGWPVAGPIAELLAGAGEIVLPAVRRVLKSRDAVWKHAVLRDVVARWPRELVAALAPELQLLATRGDEGPADLQALELLVAHGLAEVAWIEQWLAFKKRGHAQALEAIARIEARVPRG